MADPQGALLGSAYGYIDLDASGAVAALGQAKAQFNNFIQSTGDAMQQFGSSLSAWGSQLTMWTAPLLVAGGIGLQVASSFDSVLTEIQARTGLTSDAMEQVRQAALQAGADTAFSSQQSAEAFLNLLTAGLSAEEALATLPAVLDAAAAGNMDLARAADYTTSIMASFNLTAQDAGMIANAMSRAAAASPASMDEMGTALLRASASAAQFGFSVDETSAILAIFAQNGLRGEAAGTQLNSMLRNMNSQAVPTKAVWAELGISMYDAAGNARDLDAVFADLRVALDGMTDEDRTRVMMQLAGAEGMLGFQALLAGESIADMTAQMDAQSSVTEVARQMMESFAGQVDSLMGSVEALWITVLTPFMNNVLRPLIGMTIGAVNAVTAWAAANEPLVQSIVTMVAGFLALGPAIWAVGSGIQFFGFILSAIGSPIGLIISGIAFLAYLFRDQLTIALKLATGSLAIFQGMFTKTGDFVGSAISAIHDFILRFAITMGMPATAAAEMVGDIGSAFQSVRNVIGGFINVVSGAFGTFQAAFASSGDFIGSVIAGIQQAIFAFGSSMGMSIEGALAMAGGVTRAFNNIRNVIGGFISTARSALDLFFGRIQGIVFRVSNAFNYAMRNGGDLLAALHTAALHLFTGFSALIYDSFASVNWAQIGTDILNGLGSAFSTVGMFVNDYLITPLIGAFSSVDWGAVGNAILQGIGFAISTFTGWINFVTDNILTPLFDSAKTALGTIDWAQLGRDIAGFIFTPQEGTGGLFAAFMNALVVTFDFFGWVFENVVVPFASGFIQGIPSVDWGAVGGAILNALGAALNVLWAGASWAWDNLISPMINAVGGALAQVDWMQLGTNILNALGAGLMALWGAATWAYDNILTPLVQNTATAITQIDWFGVGEGIVNAIGTSLKNTFDFIGWLVNNFLTPLFTNSDSAVGQLDWIQMGQAVLNAIGQSLINTFNFIMWLKDNIFGPMLDGAGQAIQEFDWSSIGTNLMNAIKNALPNIIEWVRDNIITPIQNALTGFNPMAGIPTGTHTGIGGIGYQAHLNSVVGGAAGGVLGKIAGFASGIDFVPSDMIALLHEGERVQRADENPYNPNAQMSGMGRQFTFGDIIIENISASSPQEAAMLGNAFGDAFMKRVRNSGISEDI